jgi:hypothetical protein
MMQQIQQMQAQQKHGGRSAPPPGAEIQGMPEGAMPEGAMPEGAGPAQ